MMKKSLVLQFPKGPHAELRAQAARAQPLAKATPHHCREADQVHVRDEKSFHRFLEPIREVWIYGEAFAASRLSMIRIMARRMNAATVVA